MNDPVLGSHVRENCADEDVATVLPVAEDLAATQVLDAKAQEPVLLVRLEHSGGRVRTVIWLARAGVDKVRPIIVIFQPEKR